MFKTRSKAFVLAALSTLALGIAFPAFSQEDPEDAIIGIAGTGSARRVAIVGYDPLDPFGPNPRDAYQGPTEMNNPFPGLFTASEPGFDFLRNRPADTTDLGQVTVQILSFTPGLTAVYEGTNNAIFGATGAPNQFTLSALNGSDPHTHLTFAATQPGTYSFTFTLVNALDINRQPLADAGENYTMSFTAVPEPATLSALTFSLLGLAQFTRRKRA